jgi:hypothetical protein
MYRWVESAVNHDAALAVLCGHGVAVAVAEALMGADVRQSNGVGLRWCRPGDWSRPGGPQATLHADWPTAQMPEPWPEGCTGMMALFCLTDFTAQNGATRVIPFSQLARHRPGKACSYREHLEEPVEARRGSLLLFDSKLWHRVGPNTSAGSERLAANLIFAPAFVGRPPEFAPLIRRSLLPELPPRVQRLFIGSVAADGDDDGAGRAAPASPYAQFVIGSRKKDDGAALGTAGGCGAQKKSAKTSAAPAACSACHGVTVHPLAGKPFGATVSGVDLTADRAPSADEVRTIEAALHEHQLLVFDQRTLTNAEQLRFTGCFGPLEHTTRSAANDQRWREAPAWADAAARLAIFANTDPLTGAIEPPDRPMDQHGSGGQVY